MKLPTLSEILNESNKFKLNKVKICYCVALLNDGDSNNVNDQYSRFMKAVRDHGGSQIDRVIPIISFGFTTSEERPLNFSNIDDVINDIYNTMNKLNSIIYNVSEFTQGNFGDPDITLTYSPYSPIVIKMIKQLVTMPQIRLVRYDG